MGCATVGIAALAAAAAIGPGIVRPGEAAVIRYAGSRSFRISETGPYLRIRALERVTPVSLRPWTVYVPGGSGEGLPVACPDGGRIRLWAQVRIRIPPRGVYQAVLSFGERKLEERASEHVEARVRRAIRRGVWARGCRRTDEAAAAELADGIERTVSAEIKERGLSVEDVEIAMSWQDDGGGS